MSHVVSLRLNDDDFDRLTQLAEVHGVDRSTLIRQLIASAPLVSVRWQQPPAAPVSPAPVDGLRRLLDALAPVVEAWTEVQKEGGR